MKKTLYILTLVAISLFSSCVNRVEYTYEDVVVTRYDRWGPEIGKFGIWTWSHSNYYCNKSDKKHSIKVMGSQNYYRAYLLIDKNTKKVWITHHDCYIKQKKIDHEHFEGDVYDSYTHRYSFDYNRDSLTQKFECYALCGTDANWDMEKKWTKEQFPDTKIKAAYQMSFSRWLDEQTWRLVSFFCEEKNYDKQDLKADLAQYIEENEDKIEALRAWDIWYDWERTRWYCTYVPDSFCAIIDGVCPEKLEGYYIEKINGCDSIAMLDSILHNVNTLYELKQLTRIESISSRNVNMRRATYPVDYIIYFYFDKEGRSKYKGESYQVISVKPNYEISSHDTIDDQSWYIDCGSLYKNWRLRKLEIIK